MSAVSVQEATGLLVEMVRNPREVFHVNDPWDSEGDVEFAFRGWKVTFFNDCGDLDYLDRVVSPDGRTSEFEDWVSGDSQNNPIDHFYGLYSHDFELRTSLFDCLENASKLETP